MEPDNKQYLPTHKTESIATRKHKNRGKMGRITIGEKIELAHKVICGYHTHEYVAREMKISRSTVSELIRKIRKNPELLHELIEKKE